MGNLKGQTGLADPAGAVEGDEPAVTLPHHPGQFDALRVAPDEGGKKRGQVVGGTAGVGAKLEAQFAGFGEKTGQQDTPRAHEQPLQGFGLFRFRWWRTFQGEGGFGVVAGSGEVFAGKRLTAQAEVGVTSV